MSQNINLAAIFYSLVLPLRKNLAVPHFSVSDLSKVDPDAIYDAGFRGLVFDKDNTLTVPYGREIHRRIAKTVARFQKIYGTKMVIMSNSAGTHDDKDYSDAEMIEADLGIPVIKHLWKKPGGIRAVTDYFGCSPKDLVMFGDRILTDIVFGNRYGMLTVHTAFLTEEGDNKTAAKIRRKEIPLMRKLYQEGYRAPIHGRFNPNICLENLLAQPQTA